MSRARTVLLECGKAADMRRRQYAAAVDGEAGGRGDVLVEARSLLGADTVDQVLGDFLAPALRRG
eukprot:6185754-Pleurochrysis_carterae.AAC.1